MEGTEHRIAGTQAIPEPTLAPEDEPQFKVYRPPGSIAPAPQEFPDDYFTPTAAELRYAQASLSARTHALANAPLRTQAMREAEEKSKHARWPNTTIRVRFSDRTQVEKTFPSTDKIRSVYAFVRNSLREDVKSIKFVLYQTPPKRELKVSDPDVKNLSLAELQLAPSSVLFLKFLDESLNHEDVPAPLDPSVLARAEDLPIPPTYDAPAIQLSNSASSSRPAKAGSSTGKETKIPKWLKLGPKK